MRKVYVLTLLLVLLLGACKPSAPAQPAGTAAAPSAPASEWQTYTNAEAGFSLQMPPTWSQQTLPDQGEGTGTIHGMAFTGVEGGVEVYWGAAFGGACTTGTEQVKLAQGEVSACHATKSDGTEEWSQISYVVTGGNYFSVRAYTSNAQQSSHDLVLQVLSTLTFMPASEWQTYTNSEAGFSIKVPPNWSKQTLPDQNNGNIHGEGFTGPEGGVEVYWGVGFGGACPTGTEPVKLAQGEVPACHTTKSDGTEAWEQINYVVEGGNTFSSRAYTSNVQPSSHDLVLQVLATLTFMPVAQPTAAAALANPASQNCINQGGTLSTQTRGDEGQYNICLFEDNQQCEEWALLRGDCPVGGIKVTGYVTPAAQYCAITGGTYTVTGNSNTDNEQGTCTLKDGTVCDVWDYYNGKCTAGSAAATSVPAGDWQWYVSQEVGYALEVRSAWSQKTLPDQNGGAIHGMAYSGSEGGVEVYWGVGFGGACTTGTQPVQLAQGEVPACYAKQADGTEAWSQIGYEVGGGNSFSVKAYTSNARQSSHDLVLQVLSTLTFRVPVTVAIQPLTMEVCDGQAQAMSHTLDDLVPTQSEELLDDYIKDAWGTGCQAAITGTGVQFANPQAVVDELGAMLKEQGWTEDKMMASGIATGVGAGYRKGDQICMANAMWTPDASANCPKDQPISACQVTPEQQNYTVTLNCGEEVPVGQATPSAGGGSELLVFDSTRGGSYRDLYVMNSDGYDMSRLTRGEADSFAGPWSPDGRRIVYTTFGLTNSYITVINADGSHQSTLDQVQGSDEGFPAWSPDGSKIAFTSRRDGNNEVYVMNADGSNPIRLTNKAGDDFAPNWSPDGTKIIFVSDRDQAAGVYDLYIMNADGSGVKRLTNDKASQYSPDWSPDGKTIVFRADEGGQADIYVIKVDGSSLRKLTDNPANDWAPSWSPDGKRIAFQTNRDGNWEIYVMSADGSQPVNLTKDPADDQLPYWRP